MTIPTAVVGAAGFAGVELLRLLLQHPVFRLELATSNELQGTRIDEEYPAFKGYTDLAFSPHTSPKLDNCEVVFLAVPHTASLALVPQLLKRGITVIDLSADYRLKDAAIYERWYQTPHTSPDLLFEAVFGLPELFRPEMTAAAKKYAQGSPVLVACAGCYPTASSLAAAPALRAGFKDEESIVIIDAISGVSGAGKKPSMRTHFCFANENAEAYGIAHHRHTPEIEQILDIAKHLVFTPHLAPLNRGLLSTVTIPLSSSCVCDTKKMLSLYTNFYQDDSFVHVLDQGDLPKTSSVIGSPNAHIGLVVNPAVQVLTAVCAIDNLCKGAAGQALQCANIVCGLPEQEGLATFALPLP